MRSPPLSFPMGFQTSSPSTTTVAMLWSGVSSKPDDPRVSGTEGWRRTSAKGSIMVFPDLVMEDQDSWVALETEIEGVLRGFRCWVWKPCFI